MRHINTVCYSTKIYLVKNKTAENKIVALDAREQHRHFENKRETEATKKVQKGKPKQHRAGGGLNKVHQGMQA